MATAGVDAVSRRIGVWEGSSLIVWIFQGPPWVFWGGDIKWGSWVGLCLCEGVFVLLLLLRLCSLFLPPLL